MGAAKDLSQGKLGTELRRTIQDHVMAEEEHLPPRDAGWTEALAPMKHGAPLEIYQ